MAIKNKPNPELFEIKKEIIYLLEQESEKGNIDLYYGDETKVSQQGYIPYAWQFKDENISIKATRGKSINCFGLLTRKNEFTFKMSLENINTQFVVEVLNDFVCQIVKPTVVILDNAKIHTCPKFKRNIEYWQKKGLFIFYLPPYSPHLNIIERLWKEIKQGYLKPKDYFYFENLKYALNRICTNIGENIFINYSKYKFV